MAQSILIVDDEKEIVSMLYCYFSKLGYTVYTATAGNAALKEVEKKPDIILLDVNMPDIDGFTVCERIRDYVSCPIIFLTARIEDSDKIKGFSIGADDYVIKPFSVDELEARIAAHLRREKRHNTSSKVQFDEDMVIDYSSRIVFYHNKDMAFTKKEFDIISFLLQNKGIVFDRETIYEKVWGLDGIGDNTVVTEHMRCIYSFTFFVIATIVALKPTRLKDLLGKVMTPILLILIAVIFVGVVVKFPTVVRQADASYKGHALQHGFVTGYQTMDILAAFNFGAVIAMNIEAFGVKNRKGVAKETILAGIEAGILLCIVYSATAYIGVLCSSKVGNVENGTQILTYAVHACFGIYGKVLIGIIFFIACFNVCVGLLCCCSAYFHELVPKISYFKWLLVFSVFSFVISCAGLNAILNVSLPILKVMCPIAIALTFYGLVRRKRQ